MATKRMTPKEKLLFLLQRGGRHKFRDLRAVCQVKNEELRKLINELRQEGYQVVYGKLDRRFFLSKCPTPYSNAYDMTWLPQKGILGLISDTHLCSNAERLDLCEAAYTRFAKEGVTVVLHTGDLMDGQGIYPGHDQYVKLIGAQNQARYAIQHYPQRKGIRTFFIGGNHDLKSFEKQGVDQCSLVVNGFIHEGREIQGRKDLVYLGQYSRTLVLPNEVTVQMLHPRGANSYAISYPQQKRSREMRSETRPHLQLSGHLHQFCWIVQDYTNFLALPGLQDETEFFVRLGFPRQMGFCIAEYELDWLEIVRFRVEHFQLL